MANADDNWVHLINGDRLAANGITNTGSITQVETDRGPSLNYQNIGDNRHLVARGDLAPFYVGQVFRFTAVARYNGAVSYTHLTLPTILLV